MIYPLNETHDPKARSWVESANKLSNDFPIQNLPFGVFSSSGGPARIGVAIGDQSLDLAMCSESGFLGTEKEIRSVCRSRQLNDLMALGPDSWKRLRLRIFELLHESTRSGLRERRDDFLFPLSDIEMYVPATIGDYTDFYASIFHATRVGSMFRPNEPLTPNYKWMPIGYHGRASTVVVSGTSIKRPAGQSLPASVNAPTFLPSKQLDYELELGAYIGRGNRWGEPVPLNRAEEEIFGICVLNDWSARDIQAWEGQPLGPFLAKSFATSVSPWVVTMEALAPYRTPAFRRPDTDPQPLPYLSNQSNEAGGGIDITLEVGLTTLRMRIENVAPYLLSRTSFRDMYWTLGQMLTYHTSNGCNLRPGDLIGSGTISGPSREQSGCLLELTSRGTEPIKLASGEERRFLEDGDEIIMRGWCEAEGRARIGLGSCTGQVARS